MLINKYDPSDIPWKSLLQSGQQGAGDIRQFRLNQRGRGFGSVLAKLVRLFPTFLSSPLGRQLVSTGKGVLDNIKEGDDISTSIGKTSRSKVREMTGLGRRKNRRAGKKKTANRRVQSGGSNAKLLGFIKNKVVRRKRGGKGRRAFIVTNPTK